MPHRATLSRPSPCLPSTSTTRPSLPLCSLLAGAGALAGTSAARADDAAGVASSRMSYSRFLEYLEMGRVKKVGRQAWPGWGQCSTHRAEQRWDVCQWSQPRGCGLLTGCAEGQTAHAAAARQAATQPASQPACLPAGQ